jgi:hypothetical protein
MHRTRRMRNRRSGRSKRGGGNCWDCSPEKKEFKRIRNENLGNPDLQNDLNNYLITLDNNKLLELYSELNYHDRQYVDTYLTYTATDDNKKQFTTMLEKKQKMEKVAYLAGDQVANHLSPVQATAQSVLMLLKLLHKSSRNPESESVAPESVAPESVAVGGKSRRRSHHRRRSNKKSRKGRKSRRSSRP